MRILFVKDSLAWPRSSGHDVHGFHMMRELGRIGHEVSLATLAPPKPEATDGAGLAATISLEGGPDAPVETLPLTRLQEKFRSYWGIDLARIRAVARAAEATRAEVVVAVGLPVLPYLAGAPRAVRVWYAADEWAWHHLSLLRVLAPSTWPNLKVAAVKGLYERAYAPIVDRTWVVSDADRFAMRWVAGARNVDVLPNGVDAAWFAPTTGAPAALRSCVFWGRLDFEPNIQALEWFCGRVWPRIRAAAPDARLSIFGFKPGPEVLALARAPGVTLTADLPDLRGEIAKHELVVLPFVSGGGIKNKLLEAAGLAMPIVCTPRACGGLREAAPVVAAGRPAAFARAVLDLWASAARRRALGGEARRWVQAHHTWEAVAEEAARGLSASLAGRA